MHFPQQMSLQVRLKHSDWTPFGSERIVDAEIVARQRKYSPGEAKQQVDEAHSGMRLNLGLAFEH